MVTQAFTTVRGLGEPPAVGAAYLGDGRTRFRIWAPRAEDLSLRLLGRRERIVRLEPAPRGYREAVVEQTQPGDRYLYRFTDGRDRPDPASRSQPEGVHGPSEIVAPEFAWTDNAWRNRPIGQHVFYELHVGTFTPAGTFDAVIDHLDHLRDLGVTAIELMPIAQFPGERNWGYDGVCLFAAQHSYGGPAGLKRLVNASHAKGLAVVLDVVYNHFGPEGNYLGEFGPYFTDRYHTPWGKALNVDGPDSDEVRRFFIENALYWVTDCHVDALRLDAVHAIIDPSPTHVVEELAEAVHARAEALGRQVHVICESAANDPRTIRSRDLGGWGADAQWNDDFHHVAVSLLAPDRGLRYAGFGRFEQMGKALREGYVFTGEYNEHHRRRHGRSAREIPADRFVVFTQNHDQVGNQRSGERLSHLASFEACKLAAGITLLSPYVPMIFMGEEYAETAPFLYFVSHSDPELVEAVRRGRAEEFHAYGWSGEPPDPQDEETFLRSKLDHTLRGRGQHRQMFELYRELLRLRRETPALARPSKEGLDVQLCDRERIVLMRRSAGESEVVAVFNFNGVAGPVPLRIPAGEWVRLIDSADCRWGGGGALTPEVLRSRQGSAEIEIAASAFAAFARQGD